MIVPALRPLQPREKTEQILRANGIEKIDRAFLLGVRGYYKNSMGVPGQNDRRIYDDAIFHISPNTYLSYNANVDPNGYRPGYGFSDEHKGMANLKCGVWTYQLGIHRTYLALVQADTVTVIRDGNPSYEDHGWFGINIHHGGWESTSSLGCQTIYPEQWDEFITHVQNDIHLYGQHVIKYCLTESKD